MSFLVPLLLAGLGTGVSVYAQNEAARRQEAAAAQRYRNQMDASRQKNDAIMEGVDQYKPETRLDDYQQAQQDSTDRLMQLLSSTPKELQVVGSATAGNTGQDYELAQAKATASSTDRAYQLARMLGRIGGQSDLFRREAGRMAGAENKAMMLGNFAAGQDLIDQANVTNAGQVDPWMTMAGSALTSYGTGGFKW